VSIHLKTKRAYLKRKSNEKVNYCVAGIGKRLVRARKGGSSLFPALTLVDGQLSLLDRFQDS
jgi:hypothetical protein